ncbi:MAG: cytochrome C-554 [Nitrospinae bacterium CG11_big_fil_rev_8_21_14_0_20_56_8]|nr:MAG: cytochrome C-554 [Nitrospinae bacterium CG11_big_fil_rev_8_21_14_0_20_56_8]
MNVKGIFIAAFIASLFITTFDADPAEARKKKIPKRPKFVGAVKCNGSCHDAYYQAWTKSPHGGTYNLLKSGVRPEAKKRVNLDPEKDYTTNPLCLRCHTTGYRQIGGFKPAGTTNRKGKDISTPIDPDEPNKEQVGCEMCHSVAGGAQFRVVMKNTRGEFAKEDTEKYGQRWDYANVCTRCHTHPKTPFQPSVHEKYKFDFEARVKKVHPVENFWNEDNLDQKLKHVKDRQGETAQSEVTPLFIEDFEVKKGKLRLDKKTLPYDKKKKVFRYKKGDKENNS